MSDNPNPPRPKGPRMSHLQSEPVPISFASPQQLAQLTAAAPGSLFSNRPQMKTSNQSYMPTMHSGFNTNDVGYQKQSGSSMASSGSTTTTSAATAATTASSSSQSASSGQKPPFKPLAAQPIDLNTFKGFKFVTLDALQIETRDVYDKISGTFKWEMCESQEDRCIDCVRDECQNRRVFLVSSGSLGERIIPKIHDLPQVYAIYIYCANVKYHKSWGDKFAKVRVVCDNDDLYLLPQFAVDVAQANIDWGDALLKQGTRDKAKEKFQLAHDKLNNYARNHDPAMDMEIKKKLEECK
jgi:hypothetical protein